MGNKNIKDTMLFQSFVDLICDKVLHENSTITSCQIRYMLGDLAK